MIPGLRFPQQAVRKGVEWFGVDPVEGDPPLFRPARELASSAVEFAVGGQYPQRSGLAGCRRHQADQEVMGIRGEDDCVGLPGSKLTSDVALRLGPDLAHDLVPLAVGQARRVVPGFDLAVKAGVRPEVMAVGGEVQAGGIGAEASAEQSFEAQRAVLSDHNSGKTRFSSVARR